MFFPFGEEFPFILKSFTVLDFLHFFFKSWQKHVLAAVAI